MNFISFIFIIIVIYVIAPFFYKYVVVAKIFNLEGTEIKDVDQLSIGQISGSALSLINAFNFALVIGFGLLLLLVGLGSNKDNNISFLSGIVTIIVIILSTVVIAMKNEPVYSKMFTTGGFSPFRHWLIGKPLPLGLIMAVVGGLLGIISFATISNKSMCGIIIYGAFVAGFFFGKSFETPFFDVDAASAAPAAPAKAEKSGLFGTIGNTFSNMTNSISNTLSGPDKGEKSGKKTTGLLSSIGFGKASGSDKGEKLEKKTTGFLSSIGFGKASGSDNKEKINEEKTTNTKELFSGFRIFGKSKGKETEKEKE
jgi:hypothetical protein